MEKKQDGLGVQHLIHQIYAIQAGWIKRADAAKSFWLALLIKNFSMSHIRNQNLPIRFGDHAYSDMLTFEKLSVGPIF